MKIGGIDFQQVSDNAFEAVVRDIILELYFKNGWVIAQRSQGNSSSYIKTSLRKMHEVISEWVKIPKPKVKMINKKRTKINSNISIQEVLDYYEREEM
jgi:hypothetical protein